MAIDVNVTALALVLCDDKRESYGAPDVLSASIERLAVQYTMENRCAFGQGQRVVQPQAADEKGQCLHTSCRGRSFARRVLMCWEWRNAGARPAVQSRRSAALGRRFFDHLPEQTGSVMLLLSANFLNNSTGRWEYLLKPWPLELHLSDPINPIFKTTRTKWAMGAP
jgi:hypothetical protein